MLLHLLLQTSYLYLVFALPQRVDRINQGPASAAQILSQTSDISPDGTYITSFETSNGISYQEQGQPKAIGPDSQPDDGIRRVPVPVRSYVTNNNYTATTFPPTAVPVVVPLVNQPAVIQPSVLQQRRPPQRTRLPVVPFATLPQ
ncbi:hypothetical protein QAD02_009371 [Eretmocerus hayati]|uniref:Uncharacterized protein n=1 Tax=Eretmocerus hayati TaxID=131215 RepID=A0ACC2N9V5_9HYME|nr:hypothetical protein QAD02_009371 [Eretmocerus hayati]